MRWPDGQLVHHRASPIDGYDLCYSARPGDPVTLFTARQGLRVEMGVGVRGTLDKPLRLRDHSVEWNVISDENVAGRRYHDYLIMSHGSERLLNEWQDQGSSPGQDGSPLSGTLEVSAWRWQLLGSVCGAEGLVVQRAGTGTYTDVCGPVTTAGNGVSWCVGRPGGLQHAVHRCRGVRTAARPRTRWKRQAHRATCGLPWCVTHSAGSRPLLLRMQATDQLSPLS